MLNGKKEKGQQETDRDVTSSSSRREELPKTSWDKELVDGRQKNKALIILANLIRDQKTLCHDLKYSVFLQRETHYECSSYSEEKMFD